VEQGSRLAFLEVDIQSVYVHVHEDQYKLYAIASEKREKEK